MTDPRFGQQRWANQPAQYPASADMHWARFTQPQHELPDEPYLGFVRQYGWGLAAKVPRRRMAAFTGDPFREAKRKSFPFVAWGNYQGFRAMAMHISYKTIQYDGNDSHGNPGNYSSSADSTFCVALELPYSLPELTLQFQSHVLDRLYDAMRLDNVSALFRKPSLPLPNHPDADRCHLASVDPEFAKIYITPTVLSLLSTHQRFINQSTGRHEERDHVDHWFRLTGTKLILWTGLGRGDKNIIESTLGRALQLYRAIPSRYTGSLAASPGSTTIPHLADIAAKLT